MNCCELCGGFVLIEGTSKAAHSICPLRNDIPQLLALVQHLSDRLQQFRAKDIIKIPQLQWLVIRKYLVEKHVEAKSAHIVKQGSQIQWFECQGEVESDDEYNTFLSSLIEASPQKTAVESEAETDPPFPEDIALRTREPVEEYRDDAEVQVTNDELKELFDINDDPGCEIFTVQVQVQDSVFTMEMYNEFVKQMRQNFQLVIQGVVIAKEFVMPNLQTLDFWHSQYQQLVAAASSKYLHVHDAVTDDQIAWIPLLCEYYVECTEAMRMALASSSSQEFVGRICSRWDAFGNEFTAENPRSKKIKATPTDQLPYPRALTVLLGRLQQYMSDDMLPEWSLKPRALYTRDIEDVLLLQGLIEYGTNYQLIQEYMLPHRSVNFLSNRAKNQAAKRMGGNWQLKEYFFESRKPLSDREQQLLFQGVKEHGHNFRKISSAVLPRRTPGELRRAYALLHSQLHPPRYDYQILKRINQATRVKLPTQQNLLIVPEEPDVFDFLKT